MLRITEKISDATLVIILTAGLLNIVFALTLLQEEE